QSFIQDLSRPYYTRRPVVALPQTAMLTPQTHEGTMQVETVDAIASATPAPPPALQMKVGPGSFGGVAGGVVGGVPGGQAAGAIGGIQANDRFSLRRVVTEKMTEKMEPGASGQDLGDLFEYNLKDKVTILKNHSALVPIINAKVKAEKVTLWSARAPRPL